MPQALANRLPKHPLTIHNPHAVIIAAIMITPALNDNDNQYHIILFFPAHHFHSPAGTQMTAWRKNDNFN
jgi:hypothetical protein